MAESPRSSDWRLAAYVEIDLTALSFSGGDRVAIADLRCRGPTMVRLSEGKLRRSEACPR